MGSFNLRTTESRAHLGSNLNSTEEVPLTTPWTPEAQHRTMSNPAADGDKNETDANPGGVPRITSLGRIPRIKKVLEQDLEGKSEEQKKEAKKAKKRRHKARKAE